MSQQSASHTTRETRGDPLSMVLVARGSHGLLEREGSVCPGLECEHCYYCTSHRLAPASFDIKRREKSFVAKLSKPCILHPAFAGLTTLLLILRCLGTIMR
jgi:arginyl-tRNA--protein-N-Asp/Glu arginylyltransferase